MKTNKIKKKSFLLFLSLTLAIAACGQNSKPTNNKEVKSAQKVDKVQKKKATIYKVTFVELGSVRCIPCQKMQPIMKSVEERFGDQVKVVFHDVWTPQGKPFADKYGISAIPTQIFLDKDGKEYFRHEGFFPEDELVKVLLLQGVQ